MRYSFGKHQRVKRSSDFTIAMRRGSCAADGTLVLFAIRSTGDRPARLGVTIPKKTGNAVKRNRWKRLIRESFRRQQDLVPSGYDYIVRPKKDAKPAWNEIKASIPKLAAKALRRMPA